MLTVDPQRRISLEQVATHPWFQACTPITNVLVPLYIFDRLQHSAPPIRLTREALKIAVNFLPREAVTDVRAAFERIDSEVTGFVTVEGLYRAMRGAGLQVTCQEAESTT